MRRWDDAFGRLIFNIKLHILPCCYQSSPDLFVNKERLQDTLNSFIFVYLLLYPREFNVLQPSNVSLATCLEPDRSGQTARVTPEARERGRKEQTWVSSGYYVSECEYWSILEYWAGNRFLVCKWDASMPGIPKAYRHYEQERLWEVVSGCHNWARGSAM